VPNNAFGTGGAGVPNNAFGTGVGSTSVPQPHPPAATTNAFQGAPQNQTHANPPPQPDPSNAFGMFNYDPRVVPQDDSSLDMSLVTHNNPNMTGP
jgi:hypothetical protein